MRHLDCELFFLFNKYEQYYSLINNMNTNNFCHEMGRKIAMIYLPINNITKLEEFPPFAHRIKYATTSIDILSITIVKHMPADLLEFIDQYYDLVFKQHNIMTNKNTIYGLSCINAYLEAIYIRANPELIYAQAEDNESGLNF